MLSDNQNYNEAINNLPPDFINDPEVQKILNQISPDNPDALSSMLGALAAINQGRNSEEIKMPNEQADYKSLSMEIQPEPGFVIKTLNTKDVEGYSTGLKVKMIIYIK